MTSPSAFLYRYTPGSVGIVRIFDNKSISFDRSCALSGSNRGGVGITYSIGWENSSVCYKKADESAKHALHGCSNSGAVWLFHSDVSFGAKRSAAAEPRVTPSHENSRR